MEILEGIITRRSIRRYSEETITREQAEELIGYGMYAPSAHNCQPWHFVLMNDKNLFLKIEEFQPYSRMLKHAQWGITVCGDEQLAHTPEYWPGDCAAATQNILLAAHGLGYGAVWLGIYPRTDRMEAMKELLGLPLHIHAFCVIAVGYPAQHPPQPERIQPAKIHLNRW